MSSISRIINCQSGRVVFIWEAREADTKKLTNFLTRIVAKGGFRVQSPLEDSPCAGQRDVFIGLVGEHIIIIRSVSQVREQITEWRDIRIVVDTPYFESDVIIANKEITVRIRHIRIPALETR